MTSFNTQTSKLGYYFFPKVKIAHPNITKLKGIKPSTGYKLPDWKSSVLASPVEGLVDVEGSMGQRLTTDYNTRATWAHGGCSKTCLFSEIYLEFYQRLSSNLPAFCAFLLSSFFNYKKRGGVGWRADCSQKSKQERSIHSEIGKTS